MNLKNSVLIETERLILRKFVASDIKDFFIIFSDDEINTYLPWFPLKSLEEAKTFFNDRYAKEYEKPKSYRYAICLKSDNLPIGYINVSTDESHDLGYGLRKEFWRKGIITEAGKAIIEQLKRDNITYITATHDVNNFKSGNVMKKLGMKYQYSYKEQWLPKNIPVIFRMYQLNFDDKNNMVYKKYWDNSIYHFIETII